LVGIAAKEAIATTKAAKNKSIFFIIVLIKNEYIDVFSARNYVIICY
jgi:hypothetical protein